jgi:hypothetical protein
MDPIGGDKTFIKSCEILEVQWTPTSKDAGGGLPEAYMIILAWIVPGRYIHNSGGCIAVDGYKNVRVYTDIPLYRKGKPYAENVYCAKVAEYRGMQYWLALKCIDATEQVYERIGLVVPQLGNTWISKEISKESKRKIKVV